jgi:hypothetical protein
VKKFIALLFLAAFLCGSVVGCGSTTSPPKSGGTPTTK